MGVISLLVLVVVVSLLTGDCTAGSGYPCPPIIWDLS